MGILPLRPALVAPEPAGARIERGGGDCGRIFTGSFSFLVLFYFYLQVEVGELAGRE